MNPFLEDLAVSAMLKDRMGALKTLLHSRHILYQVAQQRQLITDESTADQIAATIDQLSGGLSVQMMGKDLIKINYSSGNAEGMKETLETVSKLFVEQLLAPERSSMKDSSYFLAEHIKYRRDELEKAETALAEFKSQNSTELPAMQLQNSTRLTQLRQRLSEKDAELAGARRSLGGLDQQLSKTNPVVGRIEEQIVQIRSELALLKARYTENHSKVQGALRNLRRLEEERKAMINVTGQTIDSGQLWDIATSSKEDVNSQPLLISQLENLQLARSRVDSLEEETSSLKSVIADLESKTAATSINERELSRLERDLSVKRQLYDELLKRYEMARLTSSLGVFEQDKRVKIIDQPFTPTFESNPPTILFVIAGLIGGVFLGSGVALILEVTDSTVRRRDKLEELTEVPVLSRIPPINEQTEPDFLLFSANNPVDTQGKMIKGKS